MKTKKRLSMKIAAVVLILTMGLSTVTAYGATVTRPTISARSAVVLDADTGKIVYSKNSHYKRDPASTTKLLTALVVVEHLRLNDMVTVTKTAANTGGSTANLKTGEKMKVKDLLYAALLPSGNDAAVALAIGVSGSKSKFSVLMNQKAKALGCRESNFSNPHGWKASTHYSSAYDMALITKAAMENATIKKVCSTEMYRLAKTNKQKSRYVATSNYFVANKKYENPGVFAGKTGTWEWNNAALASACEQKGRIMYAVVLRDTTSGRYESTNKILKYSYKKIGNDAA